MTDHLEGCCCPTCASAPLAANDGRDRTQAAPADKPVYSEAEIIWAMTTSDGTFSSVAWSRDQISYAIETPQLSPGDPGYQTEHDGYTLMTDLMESRARLAFELWDDVIAIDLVDIGRNANANITFNYSTTTASDLSYARYDYTFENNQPRSSFTITDAEIWMDAEDPAHNTNADLHWWRLGVQTYVHEIGHALGLSHPGQYNISANYQDDATHLQDTRQFTVMSYFDAEEAGFGTDHVAGTTRAFGTTPLLHDILVAQAIYGADMTTRTGNTTYGFNANAGREVFDFTVNVLPVVAIWDAGGTDVIDASGYAQGQVIDLNEGAFSSIGPLTNNLAIAYGAQIERAKGGSGNDLITGNALSNALWGLVGDDTLIGGAGTDGFFGGPGGDVIDGGAGDDWIRFANADSGVQISLSAGIGVRGEADGDTYFDIERVAGSGFGDTLQGDAGDNQILGGGGDDLLRGFGGQDYILGEGGNDTLEGGTANDILRGGPGADVLDGGAASDWVQYTNAAGPVEADLMLGGLFGEAAGDVYIDIERLGGSAFNDSLTGDEGPNIFVGREGDDLIRGFGGSDMIRGDEGNDTLRGGQGDDTLVGGPGADELNGRDGRDWADYQDAPGSVDISLARGTGIGSWAGGDTYLNLEQLWGSNFADLIEGDEAVNLLRGADGDDTIISNGGDDIIKGQGGADVFVFGPDDGQDRIFDFDPSVDTIHFAAGTVSTFAELTINEFRGDASVVYDTGDTVLLTGIPASAVDSSFFTFA